VDEGCWGPGTVFVYAVDGVLGGWRCLGVGRDGFGVVLDDRWVLVVRRY
jgi:hypothetical protein